MPETVETKISKKDVIGFIENMSVLELSKFVNELEEKFGVSAAPVAIASGVPSVAQEPAAEEKTEFDIILTSIGDKKIQVIKAARAITSLGLKEAKELVESAPKPLKTGIKREEAESIKKQIEEAGGTAEIK